MFKLNHVPSPPDIRDYLVTVAAPEGIAPMVATGATGPAATSVDLSQNMTSIKDQGSVGACTAFATVALMEFNLKKYANSKVNDVYSERFTYYATRVNVAKGDTSDGGAYLRDALASLKIYGTCQEGFMPFNGDFRNKPSSAAYKNALLNQIVTYARVPDTSPTLLSDLKAVLNGGNCFVAGFVCYDNIWDAVNGLIPLPSDTIVGGHAICFCGYDDVRQVFKFKNSWTSSWGDNGYGYLPYQYITSGLCWDIWTIFRQENNGNKIVGYVKPSRSTIKQAIKRSISLGAAVGGVNKSLVKRRFHQPKIQVILNKLPVAKPMAVSKPNININKAVPPKNILRKAQLPTVVPKEKLIPREVENTPLKITTNQLNVAVISESKGATEPPSPAPPAPIKTKMTSPLKAALKAVRKLPSKIKNMRSSATGPTGGKISTTVAASATGPVGVNVAVSATGPAGPVGTTGPTGSKKLALPTKTANKVKLAGVKDTKK